MSRPVLGAATSSSSPDESNSSATNTTPDLFTEWNTERNMKRRGEIMMRLAKLRATDGPDAAFPSEPVARREREAGLYPDPEDPAFAARLYEKREFHDARSVAAGVADGDIDPCTSAAAEKLFELTPVQRIVSRFMHPLTPYYGLLLFHGVGVGKTCSAVTISEQFLDSAPTKKVYVLAPQALKDNFLKTVFDSSKLRWDDATGQWTARQCTGVSYLERLGLLSHPVMKDIEYRVAEDIRKRYTVMGYQMFANEIKRLLKNSVPAGLTDPAARLAAENEILRRAFSDHLIIVDEAHNLRDTGAEGREEAEADADAEEGDSEGGAAAGDAAENAGGKALNPFLKRIVLNAEGLRLVLMTATPMYNSAPEIVLLLNYLLMNDYKKESMALKMDALFDKFGNLKESGAPALARAARAYVSYMRGENPFTFPLRMKPAIASPAPADEWPEISATRKPVELEEIREALNSLPIVFTEPVRGSPVDVMLRSATGRTAASAKPVLTSSSSDGSSSSSASSSSDSSETTTTSTEPDIAPVRDTMLDLRMQMANICYPNHMYGGEGWEAHFVGAKIPFESRKVQVYTPAKDVEIDSVFAGEQLRACAPKIARIVDSVRKARGICFCYSRYIKSGALPLAIALERAGFQRRLASGKLMPLLMNAKPRVSPICALCGRKESEHASVAPVAGAGGGTSHPFFPATYVLLTSDDDISPNFAGLVRQAASWPQDDPAMALWGALGAHVKVVIGSQVASEGLDLKCVREMHILDAWYHLNRTDQIIGRAIRYCSHTALRAVEEHEGQPRMTYNNCLIHLHTVRGGEPLAFESADMYAYRIAIAKAQRVGKVQRLLKAHAWDCSLEMEAITFVGLPPRKQIDSQGRVMATYDINDQDFTTYCDYQKCRQECAVASAATETATKPRLNMSTFGLADARRTLMDRQDAVRHLFDEQVIVPETAVKALYDDLPWEITSEALMELLDGRKFRLTRPDGVHGFLIKRAGYLVFQPLAVTDNNIPIALRYARAFQIRRQFMEPVGPVFSRVEEVREKSTKVKEKEKEKVVLREATATGAATGATAAASSSNSSSNSSSSSESSSDAGPSEELLRKWEEWVTFVAEEGGSLPSYLAPSMSMWTWILTQFSDVKEDAAAVALRWWYDKVPSYTEKRQLIEYAIKLKRTKKRDDMSDEEAALVRTLAADFIVAKQLVGYQIFNSDEGSGEYWCLPLGSDAGTTFGSCSSEARKLLQKTLRKPVLDLQEMFMAYRKTGDIPPKAALLGPLFGFLTSSQKSSSMIFKSMNFEAYLSSSRKTLTGAECAIVSNLAEHRPRVRILHAAAREDEDLAPLIIPDDASEYGGKTKGGAIEHLHDITHSPLCLYLEFLTRLLERRKLGGRRWFLDAMEAEKWGFKAKK